MQMTVCKVMFSLWLILTSLTDVWTIDVLEEHELEEVVRHHQYVLVLLDPGACDSEECRMASSEVNLVSFTSFIPNLRVYEVLNSNFAKSLSPDLKYRIIFYRNALPILYDLDAVRRDDILTWMEAYKEPASRQLDSSNFEHLTQAATGATTGDWFILFYSPSCVELMPVWEAVATRLSQKMNVAVVDVAQSPELKTRFNIVKCPTILFFRLGKMYSYDLSIKEVSSLVAFADGWYANAQAYPVPTEPTPFDALVDNVVDSIKESSWFSGLGFNFTTFCVVISFILILLFIKVCWNRRRKHKLF